jgi:hypothetical protein
MSSIQFIKTDCEKCGQSIEFPKDGIGTIAQCPSCGAETRLSSEVNRSRLHKLVSCCLKIEVILLGMLLLNFVGMFGIFYYTQANARVTITQIDLINSTLKDVENNLGGINAALEGSPMRPSLSHRKQDNILGTLNQINENLEKIDSTINRSTLPRTR